MKTRKLIGLLLLTVTQLSFGQEAVRLSDCQQWAREQHPLLKQKELYEQIKELKLANNQTNYFPQVDLNGQATYQTDVTKVGISLPNVSLPELAKDQYKLYADVKQSIWDGGLTKGNELLELAKSEADQQGVEVELYQVQERVNNTFFASFLIQKNLDLLAKKEETLKARIEQLQVAVEQGTLLASELDQLLAEQVKVKQQQLELETQRETALATLAILTGKEVGALSNLEMESSEFSADRSLSRPELQLFEKQTEMLSASADLIQKKRNPKLFGFGQLGYGRPGLNMLSDDFDTYALVGVGLNWTVFDWKKTKREKETISMQQQLVATRQQDFERNMTIALDSEYRKIKQLEATLQRDRELIALQQRITQSSASKLENGTITTSDYIQDLNAELSARITLETHKVQLEAAKINYQTIKGI